MEKKKQKQNKKQKTKLDNPKSTIFNLVSTITLITIVFLPTLTDA